MVPVSAWFANRFSISLRRKRKCNCYEGSRTTGVDLPDALWSIRGAMLLKGEDKKFYSEMVIALEELTSKLAAWSDVYDGKVEYLLCYARAEDMIQFCALQQTPQETEGGRVHTVLHKLGTELNLKTTDGVLNCIHHTILLTSIICLQSKQLPSSYIHIGSSVFTEPGTTITYGDREVEKRVDLSAVSMSLERLSFLGQVYQAVRGEPCLVQALEPPATTQPRRLGAKQEYCVTLWPVGTALGCAPANPVELYNAVRCILQGLRVLHSNNIGHGDLRWPNVIKTSASQFVLIDLEGAMPLGSTVDLDIQMMPIAWQEGAVLENNRYTAKSDLLQLANMLRRRHSAAAMMTALEAANSAEEAWASIKQLQK
ncbi:hypothetical protein JKP88DRAFT_243346 [Tribonema minus]|uniref:Protein kinase domain-containing protein n=1 Tax=Tribonema minus TaxID=303371 RepID=A0A836CK34_9STRA|nr:hypothetical protein JKP88DRAFT_243346 [Tribonema minus]